MFTASIVLLCLCGVFFALGIGSMARRNWKGGMIFCGVSLILNLISYALRTI